MTEVVACARWRCIRNEAETPLQRRRLEMPMLVVMVTVVAALIIMVLRGDDSEGYNDDGGSVVYCDDYDAGASAASPSIGRWMMASMRKEMPQRKNDGEDFQDEVSEVQRRRRRRCISFRSRLRLCE